MRRIHIGLTLLLYCTVLNVLHAILKRCPGVTKRDPLHNKGLGYISSLEKQNTANSVHLKHITLIKRKKKKFILAKKKRDPNMLITLRASQQEGADGIRRSPPLCMLSQDCQDPSDGRSGQSGGSGEDGGDFQGGGFPDGDLPDGDFPDGDFPDGGGEADATNGGQPHRQLQPASEALSPSSPGHDDGDDVEDDTDARRKKKKRRKQSKEGRGNPIEGSNNPTEEDRQHDRNEDMLNVDTPEYNAHLSDIENTYLKKAETMDKKDLAGLDKEKMIEEYNRLVQILKESGNKKMMQYEGNEKKNIYELNERVINSSRKLNLEKMKKEIEKSFTPNDAVEKKIHDYMYMFTQSSSPPAEASDPSAQVSGPPAQVSGPPAQVSGPSAQVSGPSSQVSGPSSQVSGPSAGTTDGSTVGSFTRDGSTPDGTPNSSARDADAPREELIQEHEERENREILRRLSRGDYSGVDKFHFKFSAKDLDRMKDIESTEEESAEERKLIDAAFDRIMKDNTVVKEMKGREKTFLQLYEQGRRENIIERDEEVENLKYYNEMQMQRERERSGGGQNGDTAESSGETSGGTSGGTGQTGRQTGELIDRKLFFNRVSSQFVDIKKEDIEEMSEAQVRDELRKRGYPTFGSIKEIKMRLEDVMRIRKNHEYDIRTILKNPEKHVLSHIRLDKLKENLKEFKENERYGDTESKIKQLDASMEISNFINDPVDYLRIDTTDQFAGETEGHSIGGHPVGGHPLGGYSPGGPLPGERPPAEEDLSKVPIVNDCDFSEQISMAEKLRKNFTLEGDERQPDEVIRFGSEEETDQSSPSSSERELQEQKEEMYRKEVLKFGGLQETVQEFHSKHSLPLDFIGDFICKMSSQTTSSINRYWKRSKGESEALKKNQLEMLMCAHSINRDFIVPKFVDTNELISRYLTTKDIVTLIEYSNMADPVDIIHFYSPETIFMLSEEYGITVDRVIDMCTRLNIRLPFGGDTHLNANCFNVLTTYLARVSDEDKRLRAERR
ncbi:hypothetical protein C922_03481 [Plasmodium inui San Antonio 1]|uniref:SAP domain-containing protein n=1 Tax=Plasmodium inui San Antonio 1 TaxID=1237626 RepID=W7AL15_9APIC|nr:hypothetical protein C922_03481 [Plasmodium inui San Antonio 1]EUD66011.1 hypothetical protein C922_03481 [Plasmodium inui San Antonio 1]